MRQARFFAGVVLAAGVSSGAAAQGNGPGFLFGPPRGAVTIRTGWSLASAGSDVFSFTTNQLTLDRRDFSGAMLSVDATWRVLPRTELVASAGITATVKRSEFRDFVDNNELPIEQSTEFARAPLTIGLRQNLGGTGRQVGRFAWVPSRVTPFVGAGAGVMYYRFKQYGDFIDFATMDVFPSQFVSEGWTPTAYASAGVDYSLSARIGLTAEGRYHWARANLSRDFSGFDKIDLAGLATTVGVSIRY
ncbi:MAG TPA: hypothetical protein VE967_05165 [Gemmatimonadaceae bacterium]|nr:hypothetical protein [Gemmatimonadaceae bacterium]